MSRLNLNNNPNRHLPAQLIWNNRDLLIVLAFDNPKLEKLLSYTIKDMVQDNANRRSQKTKYTKAFAFSKFKHPEDGRIIYQTHQGFLDEVCALFAQTSIPYTITDGRSKFPKPKLENMQGFRFNQKEILTKALISERSGLIKAPTRYGKTVLMTNTINAFPDLKILCLGPGIEVLKGTKDIIKRFCKHDRDIKLLCTGSKDRHESDDITICSFGSMHKLDKKSFDLVLIDEPHMAVTDGRVCHLTEFEKARIIGYGATTEGRWSGNDILITGVIGPVLSETTYLECVELGALCPIHVYMVNVPYKPKGYKTYSVAYNNYMFNNDNFNKIVGKLCNECLPPEYQTLVFIDNEKQAVGLQPNINKSLIAMDKLFKNKKQRDEIFTDLKDEKILRCICSNIYSTGVTIDNIRAEINCAGGGGGILAVQKPGRLAEVKEGKKEGIMIDFMFTPTSPALTSVDALVQRDSMARLMKYREKGYLITFVNDINNLKF